MRLSAPKQITWIVALVLAILALLGGLDVIAALGGNIAFWLAFVSAVLLLLATWLKDL